MTLVKIFYIISIFLLPYTQHPLYLTQVKRYFFGFFAIAGPLFTLFGLFSTISVLMSIYLLIKNLSEEKVSIKKTRIKIYSIKLWTCCLCKPLRCSDHEGLRNIPRW